MRCCARLKSVYENGGRFENFYAIESEFSTIIWQIISILRKIRCGIFSTATFNPIYLLVRYFFTGDEQCKTFDKIPIDVKWQTVSVFQYLQLSTTHWFEVMFTI